jgi:hypothetical protein
MSADTLDKIWTFVVDKIWQMLLRSYNRDGGFKYVRLVASGGIDA